MSSSKLIILSCIRGSTFALARSITLLRLVGRHSRDPGRPICLPGLCHELLKVFGRVHVHLAPHEVDWKVRGDAAADKVEAADARRAVRARDFALCPTALLGMH